MTTHICGTKEKNNLQIDIKDAIYKAKNLKEEPNVFE